MSNRKVGYFFVKSVEEETEIAFWTGGHWQVIGADGFFDDSLFSEIGGRIFESGCAVLKWKGDPQ